jgi:hypothetical protein
MALPALAWLLATGLGVAGADRFFRGQRADALEGVMGQPGGLGLSADPLEAMGGEQVYTPGSGLRGAYGDDPQALATLEAMMGMSRAPGFQAGDIQQTLMGLLQRDTHLGGIGQTISAERDRMIERFGFEERQQAERLSEDSNQQERRIEAGDTLERARARSALELEAARARSARELEELRQRAKPGGRELPPNMTFYPQPGGGLIPGPLPGTPEYAKSVDEVVGRAQAVGRVDQILESYHLGGRGREFIGRTAGEQMALYSRIVADIAKAEGAGVLQPGELERITNTYPSPQDFFNKLSKGDEYLLGVMGQLRQGFAGDYDRSRQAHPWMAGKDLPPAPSRESVAKKYLGAPASAEVRDRLQPLPGAGAGRRGVESQPGMPSFRDLSVP